MSQHRNATKMQRVYAQAAQRKHNDQHAEQKLAEAIEIRQAVSGSQNAVDIAWLEHLERRCGIEAVRVKIVRSLTWLRANPTKALNGMWRAQFERIERAIAMVARGETPERQPNSRPPRSRPWPKPERPAWMNDPSQLPKKPPGRTP